MSNQPDNGGISLKGFKFASHGSEFASYVSALESFDRLEQLKELKALGHERTGIGPGARVLDVGCGFRLETLRLARLAAPDGLVAGCDLSSDFLTEAQGRAAAAGINVAFEQARVEAWPSSRPELRRCRIGTTRSGSCRRSACSSIFSDVRQAVSEMRRVLRPGGRIASIEPDISTSTPNLPDRALMRRVMGHEAEANVAHGWLPGQLPGILEKVGFSDIDLATRVVIFAPELAASYFAQCGHSAAADGVISAFELRDWNSGIQALFSCGQLFATVGYFLFTATA
jgi:SAM-dependent methyltransferase